MIPPSGGTRFGTGCASFLPPVRGQKDWGKWSLFGGGGWTLNPGAGNRDFWRADAALTRKVASKLTLGIEATRQGQSMHGALTGVSA